MKDKLGVFATNISDVKTGSWRLEKPVVSEGCRACGICAKYCPGQLIEIKNIADIDYEYCKGCGICAAVCPFDSISMIEEVE